jgi:ferredoxin-nitrate reductase
MERVSWDTAIGRAAGVFRSLIERHGPESVGFYISGQCLTEEYYIANKLMKGFIGCNNIDTNSRMCMSSAVVGYKLALGDDLCPISYDDIEHGDCFLIAGANPAWCHPILFRRLESHKERNPTARVIVVDPRRTQSCALADLHLQIQPGTDVCLYNAIARELLENNWIDRRFIQDRVEGFEACRAAAMERTVDEAAALCRVPAEDIRLAARWIGASEAFQTWWAMGLNQSASGVDKNLSLLNLSLLRGQIGKPGAGPFSLTGQPNAMGGREVGGMATMLAAHRDLADDEARAEVARFWGVKSISEKPGKTATEMFDALASGEMKAIWIICTNPAVSMPSLARAEAALKNARFVVAQDISAQSDTLDYADLVLPAAGWLEKQGVMTNSERRVTHLAKLVDAPGEALPDVEILCRFARAMGWERAFTYADESEIFAEHCALTRGTAIDMSGLSYERLQRENGVQWPCPSTDRPGTPRLFADGRFPTRSGRARLSGVSYEHTSESVSDDYPFVLTTGRIRDQWHTMTRTGKVSKLKQHEDSPFVEIHPADAAKLELREGDSVHVANTRGELSVRARVTDTIKPGVLFMPMHWGRAFNHGSGRVNVLTSSRVDPRSREPDFKYCAVAMKRLPRERRRIIIVGGGAAALQFIQSYRERNTDDEIRVFGREKSLFYNRILLPDYIGEQRTWEELQTCTSATLQRLGVQFCAGTPIARIDPVGRHVTDQAGRRCGYDTLILATGSRAAAPVDAPLHASGVFTLRTKDDADRVRSAVGPGTRAIIAGGGLLALELAAVLHERGAAVSVVHRSSKLMRDQLDGVAAELLREEMHDRGIEILLNDSLRQVHCEDRVRSVRTAGGRYLPCDALFYAMGTQPNFELARDAGLACGRGVIVDDTLRTSDPNIYAIGEVALHRDRVFGTTLAAQAQAEVVAAHLGGDTCACYEGSVSFNVLKVAGLALCAMGITEIPNRNDPRYEEVIAHDLRERLYMKCIIHCNRLVGAILFGDTRQAGQFKEWIVSKVELDEHRSSLLRPSAALSSEPMSGRLVCSCHSVGEGNLLKAIAGGLHTLPELCRSTRAGTGCGSCRPEVQALLERSLARHIRKEADAPVAV